MNAVPPGWYADPDPAQADRPGRLRYWDGHAWTEHIHEQPVAAPGPPPSYPGYAAQPYAAQPYAAQPYAAQPYAAQPYVQPYGQLVVPRTPDGQPLAGWWWRVLAAVLDGLITFPLQVLVALPSVIGQWDALRTWYNDTVDAAQNGLARPPTPALLDPTSLPGLTLVLSLAAVSIGYNVGFLRWKQATPGKLITGLRVRRRETPGALPWATILLRVGFVSALSLLSRVPIAGILVVLVLLLNYLWPLWDSKKQALHDKVAGTNVVMASQTTGQVTEVASPPRW